MFQNSSINFDILRKRAHNLRWATVPEGTIPLTAADPDFPCAPEIAEAICSFAGERYFSYGPTAGLPQFKNAVAKYFVEKRNIITNAASVLPVDSAAFGIYITCKAFLSSGDEAIIFDPVDFLFRYSVEAAGGQAVTFPIPPGAKGADFNLLESLVTKKTRLICLCNPLNPTGKVFTKEELLEFGRIANKYNLIILSDEIWSDIVFAPHHFTSIASLDNEIRNRTITITGYSKSYGLAGLRIGAVMATNPTHFEKLLEVSLHQSTVHGANIISQVAATAALEKCGPWLQKFLQHLQKMRDLCIQELNPIDGISCHPPEGCYVVFANIKGTQKDSREMQQYLLDEAKVAVVPGLKEWFGEGAKDYIRLSFATSEDILRDAFRRIKNVL